MKVRILESPLTPSECAALIRAAMTPRAGLRSLFIREETAFWEPRRGGLRLRFGGSMGRSTFSPDFLVSFERIPIGTQIQIRTSLNAAMAFFYIKVVTVSLILAALAVGSLVYPLHDDDGRFASLVVMGLMLAGFVQFISYGRRLHEACDEEQMTAIVAKATMATAPQTSETDEAPAVDGGEGPR